MSHGWRSRVGGWVCVGFGLAVGLGGVGCATMGGSKPDLPGPGLPLPSKLPAPEPRPTAPGTPATPATPTAPGTPGPLPRMSSANLPSQPIPSFPTGYQRPGPEAAVTTTPPPGGIGVPAALTAAPATRDAATVSVERTPIAATPPAGPIRVPTAPAGSTPTWTRTDNPVPTTGLSDLRPTERPAPDSPVHHYDISAPTVVQPDSTDMLKDIPKLPETRISGGGGGGIVAPTGPITMPPLN